jgi:hypothetical protein
MKNIYVYGAQLRIKKIEDEDGRRTVEVTVYDPGFVDDRDPDGSRASKDICTFDLNANMAMKLNSAFQFLNGELC